MVFKHLVSSAKRSKSEYVTVSRISLMKIRNKEDQEYFPVELQKLLVRGEMKCHPV